ncbi:MAG TPA: PLD nuclease N-terminal domain-containing protein [Rhodothermales bacterium]|nr:PLD nuclease N-terminal domain-containing protein [Rhodothermales bacterium]
MNRLQNPNAGVLVVLAVAALAVFSGCGDGNFGHMISRGPSGICGILHIIACIYAFIQISQSRADGVAKVLWALGVFFFPVIGLVVWYFAGPKKA